MDSYQHKGDRIEWLNELSVAVSSGEVVVGADFIAVALVDIPADATGTVAVDGVFELAADPNDEWDALTQLWWDDANNRLSENPTDGVAAGMATDKHHTWDTTAKVLINCGRAG